MTSKLYVSYDSDFITNLIVYFSLVCKTANNRRIIVYIITIKTLKIIFTEITLSNVGRNYITVNIIRSSSTQMVEILKF